MNWDQGTMRQLNLASNDDVAEHESQIQMAGETRVPATQTIVSTGATASWNGRAGNNEFNWKP